MVTIQTQAPQRVTTALAFAEGCLKYPGGGLVKAKSRAIRVGDFLYQSSNSSDNIVFGVVKYTKLRQAITNTDTELQVDDAHAFEVGDEITVGTLTAQTCTAINYATRTITLDTTPGTAAALATDVSVNTDSMDDPVAVANLPLQSRFAPMETPDYDVFYGDAFIKGTFWIARLMNGHFANGNRMDSDLAGRFNSSNGTYIIDRVSADYEN